MSTLLLSVPPAGPEESSKFLTSLAKAKGLGALLGGGGDLDLKELLSNPQVLALLIPILLGLLKNASGGGAGKPGALPTVPVVPDAKPTPPKEEADDVPEGKRTFAGLGGHYGNFQRGKAGGGVRQDPARGNEVLENGANIFGPEKTKFIAYLTPDMSDGEGLQPGDEENEDIEVDYYGLIFDGKEYRGDAMKELGGQGILINNMDSSNGMNPRVVIDGMSGDHTFAVVASVNGHRWVGKTLNVKGLK